VLQSLSGLHPTNVGSIQVHCYADAGGLEKYGLMFRRRSRRFKWMTNGSTRRRREGGVRFELRDILRDAVIGGVVAMAVWFMRRWRIHGSATRIKAKTIDEYLAALDVDQRTALERLRKTIRSRLPGPKNASATNSPRSA